MRNIVAFRFVWSLCFLIGASTHARDIWQGGLFPYSFVPFALNALYSLGHEFGFELWLQTLFLIFVLATFAKVSSSPAITGGVGHA